MKRSDRIKIAVLAVLSAVCFGTPRSFADSVPYDTYNYDYWGEIVYTPAAYVPDGRIRGDDLGIGDFSNAQGMSVRDETVYVADTNNNRIVVILEGMNEAKVIDSFMRDGEEDHFRLPQGICAAPDGSLYVADTGNNRIVVLSREGDYQRTVENPENEILGDHFVFSPMKVEVDSAGRMYVIAANMYQGVMKFDPSGIFTGFTGTIQVSISPAEIFWRRFSTKEQRARQQLFIATEFTGMDIDEEGFLYATNKDENGKQAVRRLNPKGQDVLTAGNGNTSFAGDLSWRYSGEYSGASVIVDVSSRDHGIYSILDYTRGRIFTYDEEGDLLYIFGGLGSQRGTFKMPTALEYYHENLLVLDARRNDITVFSPTKYGALINEAIALRYEGLDRQAVACWEQVLELDANFELAYRGIGKSYLASGDNRKAMEYLMLGMDKEYYSIAYMRYRNERLKEVLPYVLTAGIPALFLAYAVSAFRRLWRRRKA